MVMMMAVVIGSVVVVVLVRAAAYLELDAAASKDPDHLPKGPETTDQTTNLCTKMAWNDSESLHLRQHQHVVYTMLLVSVVAVVCCRRRLRVVLYVWCIHW